MASNYNSGEAPYYDTFDKSKGYSRVLFKPGLILQSAELNELQSILKQNIRDISGTLLTNGDIIEGCQCIISAVSEGSIAKKVVITKGKVYLDGGIYDVEETTLALKGAGTETIGILIHEQVITSEDDPELLDPSAGYANVNMSGADRLKTTVEVVTNNDNAATLFTVVDGELLNTATQNDETVIEKINTTLARRTYDESGNYRVYGCQLSAKGLSDENYIYLTASAGKAYIQGNEISKPTATQLALKRSKDLRYIETEVQEFTTGTKKYPLNNNPVVEEGLELKAYVEATTTITKGVSHGSDPFPEIYTRNGISEILEVTQPASGNTYTVGSNGDCRKNGNSIKWNENGKEPNSGSTYTVRFSYIKTMDYNIDYDLLMEDGKYYIRILNGVQPINKTDLLVDYNFMLYRRDVIVMDYLGNYKIIEGQSDTLLNVASPVVNDENVMVMGSVLLQPLNDEVIVINNKNARLSMNELQSMAERLSNLEQSVAVSDLDKEAMAGEDATSLIGIYTDGFIGFTKCDVDHPMFNAAIDLDNNECTISASETLHELKLQDRTDITPNSKNTAYGSLVTAPATETVVAKCSAATGTKLVNQYKVFPSMPVLTLTPRVNNWVDESNVVVQGSTVVKTVTLRRWWYHRGASWEASERAQWIALGFADGGASLGWASSATNKKSSTQVTSEEAIMYMKQITVTAVGQMLEPYTDNIIVTFDGRQMNMTPANSSYKGSLTGTLKANADGYTKGTFVVPANTLCGTVEVQLYPQGNPKLLATASYTSNGTKRTTTKTVWTEIIKINPTDPLAQSFQFDKDQFLTAVGLYFLKGDDSCDISVQIRNVVNGYPGTTCYGEKILKGADVKTSTAGTVETKVVFDDPIYCLKDTQYCIVILTESNVASMFYSELGGTDILTKAKILKLPYTEGMMFSSSNAITWTAHQDSNLKFNIYGNSYKDTGYVYFTEINNVSYDRLLLMADTSIPVDTELTWEYSDDGGMKWYPIVLFEDIELSKLIGRVLVRAKFRPGSTVSPAVLLESCYLIGFMNTTECNYVSRNIVLDEAFHNVKQVLTIKAPEGTSVSVFYAIDTDGIEWKSAPQTKEKVIDEAGWIQYTFEDNIAGNGGKNFRARIYMITNDRTVRPRVKNLMNILT